MSWGGSPPYDVVNKKHGTNELVDKLAELWGEKDRLRCCRD
ncbi:MAG: hypothetical protein NZ899_02405 [Thermoguttaceae bacterium]|nr:hypothetical protein [Thermoguttaceae bacterium]MDW8079822.1 hypothetical protein [Thermoguttaceae bacterium]